jgi:hypothetical protein
MGSRRRAQRDDFHGRGGEGKGEAAERRAVPSRGIGAQVVTMGVPFL